MSKKKEKQTSWPKPCATPKSSLVLLLINIVAIYYLLDFNLSVYWIIPSLILNVFFFHAEKDIYFRDKRNFDSWYVEVKYSLKKPSAEEIWVKNINSIQRKRKSNYKQQKRQDWVEGVSTIP